MRCLAEIARALIWFQPLMWIVWRQLREEQELACDNRVLAAGGKPSAYAKLLLDWSRSPGIDSLIAVGITQRSSLKRRLYALLDSDLRRDKVGSMGVAGMCFLVLALAVPLAALSFTEPEQQASAVTPVEEIAVKVNGDIITRGDILEQQHLIAQQLQQREHLTGSALQKAVDAESKDMLRGLIDQHLLVQKAKELDIKVESDINRYLAQLQVMSKIPDPDKFHDWIREQTGMTFEDFKQKKTDEYLTQRLIGQEIQSHIGVPEADMQKYYNDHKADFVRKDQIFLSEIVISTEGKTLEQVAAAEKRAQDLASRARNGEKFSDLARANSDDPETSRNGGQLPPYGRGMMPADMDTKVFAASTGTVLDPIKRPQGFFILRVDDRYDAGQETFDEARGQIQELLARPLMGPKVRDYLTKLRREAFLEIKDGYIDTGAAPGKDTRWH